MRSTRARKGADTVPPSTSTRQSNSATVASQKKKTQKAPSRKRRRRLSEDDDIDEEDSANEDDNTSTALTTTQPTSTTAQPDQLSLPTPSVETDELPTLQNFDTEQMMQKWTPSRCKERLALGFKGRISKDGKEEIKALIRKYEHLKMMVALATRCSLRTVNKKVAGASKKAPSPYLYFRIFGKRTHTEPMPHPDDEEIVEKLGSFNRATGDNWTELNADQQAIFEHTLLLALAGVPDLAADHVDTDDEDEDQARGDTEVVVPEVTQLTEEEETRYRPIYDQLVNHDKVVARFGASIPGISDAKFTRRSLRCIQSYQRDLIADAHRHEFDFWLVASSSVPPLQPGTLTWCKVTTTLPIMTKWVKQKANFPTIFGAVSQGTSLIQAVSQATGSQVVKSQPRKNKSDTEKVNLGQELLAMLTVTLGETPRGLPRGPNIDKVLAARKPRPVRIVQLPGSKLTADDLAKGFVEMNAAGRRRWKHDIDAKLFQFQLIHNDISGENAGDGNAAGGGEGDASNAEGGGEGDGRNAKGGGEGDGSDDEGGGKGDGSDDEGGGKGDGSDDEGGGKGDAD